LAAHNKSFVILCVAFLIQCQGVTDGQKRQTDAQAMAKTCEAFCYRA